jgi:hypothetical protein
MLSNEYMILYDQDGADARTYDFRRRGGLSSTISSGAAAGR